MSFDFLTRSWRPYLLLILLCCTFYIPGLTRLPPTDRDEARFAQASRQMLESGNYIDIRFQNVPRYKKPIGIYWLQAGSAAATVGADKRTIWPYRIPSALGALLAVLLTFEFGKRLFDRRTALLGSALLASSVLLNVEAHIATTDAVLLASIVAMQGFLARLYLDQRQGRVSGKWTSIGFWVACGLGTLVKGPVPPAVALLTLLTLSAVDRRLAIWKTLKAKRGLLIYVAIVLPWFIAISIASHGTFVQTAVGSDLLPKLMGGQEAHGAPPGYYALLFSVLFWPASVFAVWAIWPSWKERTETAVRFCLAWIVPNWLLFELVPTKLPHYVLPTFPAIALLTARFLLGGPEGARYLETRFGKVVRWVPLALWGIVGAALAVGLVGLPLYLNHRLFATSLVALAGAATVLAGVHFAWQKGRTTRAAVVAIAGALLMLAPAFGTILPGLDGPWISRTAAKLVQKYSPRSEPVVASVGYDEPSLVFLLGTGTRLVGAAEAVQSLQDHPDGYALVADNEKKTDNTRKFMKAAEEANLKLFALDTFRGYNYSKGKWLNLTLYAAKPH
jgi:4-amino-4-deoxy-L-arabinose transferase-like glycosyltransferase